MSLSFFLLIIERHTQTVFRFIGQVEFHGPEGDRQVGLLGPAGNIDNQDLGSDSRATGMNGGRGFERHQQRTEDLGHVASVASMLKKRGQLRGLTRLKPLKQFRHAGHAQKSMQFRAPL